MHVFSFQRALLCRIIKVTNLLLSFQVTILLGYDILNERENETRDGVSLEFLSSFFVPIVRTRRILLDFGAGEAREEIRPLRPVPLLGLNK